MQIAKILRESLHQAAGLVDQGSQIQSIHRNRSKQFVETVAERLRGYYQDRRPTIRVLSKHCALNRNEFGLNELLFDILVCDTGKCYSNGTELTYTTKAIWAIESEMAQDTRQALYDFNKIILAHSDNKLFIGPQTKDEAAFLDTLLPAARHCDGTVFIALIPHPRRWKTDSLSVNFWQLESNQWHKA